MTTPTTHTVSWLFPVHKANFSNLLKGKPYLLIRGQLLYEKEGTVFLTEIDNDKESYTVKDYNRLPEGAPYELIQGKLKLMSAPNDPHQLIHKNLIFLFELHMRQSKVGIIRNAPYDVEFNEENVFQPDLIFLSNEKRHLIKDKKRCYGAPDLVVEILSAGTKAKDFGEKMKVYGQFNVAEYWIIDPDKQSLEIFVNEKGSMKSYKKWEKTGIINSLNCQDLSFELAELFVD